MFASQNLAVWNYFFLFLFIISFPSLLIRMSTITNVSTKSKNEERKIDREYDR